MKAGQPLSHEYLEENIDLVRKGCANLRKHISNAKKFGVSVVVAVNKFETDTEGETEAVLKEAEEAGAFKAVVSNHWAEGGSGAQELAEAVEGACASEKSSTFSYLYDLDLPVKEKIGAICSEIYGADGVDFSELAEGQIKKYEESGFGKLPICIAKTQYSLSCDPSAKGVPEGFRISVRELRVCVGAGFLLAIAGDIMTIPGLPTRPGFYDVDLDCESGAVVGLF